MAVCGHPPLLLRNGRIVKTLVGEVRPPLGVSGGVVASEEMLEPADRVLFLTDGVVEARSADGEFFGVDHQEGGAAGRRHGRRGRVARPGRSPPRALRHSTGTY
ncbi:MAG: serine/threonine-protein phosphatase [Actinomycetota bacterium]|nr:serine/threonine-protein phosphatase [Actinomycetota bacterium]